MEDFVKIIEEERKKGKKIVFTNGCFDIIHAGHVDYLEKAKKLGDFLVVGLNSDNSVKRLKGNTRPINPQEYRKKVLEGLKAVDLVVIFEEDTPENLIKAIKPDILVKGGDWKIENIVGADFVKSYGGQVLTIDFIYDISTSKIIKKILENSK
ncbi:D-glycero-beta-D-manno-heptose 1-phosphate adenylyltransferase [Venenivibrio stagnispumantis]|uniref:D-glycero-beta-D-manno-heptose 1-phosphate adenylyltransferase n=1 Tax=Venenivibrio stagnispumantis TaxID=407998 RepID=A0AA45WM60_9AQUI|nr:D-glycero-beta-D-manno-heptose 1-phosphate adenylyltransferase [Venenivibrio stagnispumantis]MCW4572849.1 D-glycero-beta-D-manno-heptose 1-phosphate adenylyltransferase [Venenivibrio stagnispumantis]SMP13120.1 FMN adenylyltransferase [Venenivibrio stagnispumantis]